MKKLSLSSLLFVLFAVLAFSPVVASASLIYEQTTLYTSEQGAYQYIDQQLADDFIPLVSEALVTVTWRGSYYGADNPSSTESFTVQLYTDNGGLPSATPIFEVVGPASKAAAGTLQGRTLYEYSMTVSGPILNAGTTYWINIYTNDSPQNYAWADSTDGTSAGALRHSPLESWGSFSGNERSNHIFALHGGSVCTPPPSAMVSWWGGDNNTLDMAGTNNGTLVGNTTYATGKVGQAFSFDGAGDYVSVPDSLSLDITSQITLDAWIYPTSLGGRLVDKITAGISDGYLLDTNDSVVRLIVGNQALEGATVLPLNTWTHVAGTYNGTTMTVYINGVSDGTRAASISIPANSLPLRIGADSNGGNSFSGSIDEVEVFNRSLSASEIAAIYNAGSAGKCRSCVPPPSNMVSWWDGEGDAGDIIGTNHGTLQNGATFATGKVGQAFSLDGLNDFISIPDAAQFNIGAGDFSLSLWANYSAVRSGGAGSLPNVFLGQDEGGGTTDKWVFYSTDTGLWFHINGPASRLIGPAAFTPQTDRWYQLSMTRSGSVYAFYADGIKIGEIADSTAIPDVSAPLTIGQAEGLGFFNGLMDEITVFNRALSASEIAAIYNAGSAGQCTQPTDQYTLTVVKGGTGAGTVTATGISCGTDCSEPFNEGTVVTLTASPSTGSLFAGWSGDPDCLDGTVTMNTDKTCTAIFNLAPDLSGSWTWIRKSGPDKRGIYKVSGSLSLSNTGAVPANNAVVNVYLSDNSTYEPGDTLIASLNYGSLKGKITKGKSFNLTTKKNPSGKYVIAVIDPSNIVKESNETNNSVFRLFP